MNSAAIVFLGLALGSGQAGADYYPLNVRSLKLDIDYQPERRQEIQQVQLLVSRDEGQTWAVVAAVTPDKDHFVFTADSDGKYWINMVIVYRNGMKEPPDVTRVPPAQKLLIDATQPEVELRKLAWEQGDVVMEWTVRDAYPNDAVTEVAYRAAGPIDVGWQPVPSPQIRQRTVRFRPSIEGPLLLRVTVKDLAGNSTTLLRELAGNPGLNPSNPAMNPVVPVSTSGSPGTLPPPVLNPTGATATGANPGTGPILVPPALSNSSPVDPQASQLGQMPGMTVPPGSSGTVPSGTTVIPPATVTAPVSSATSGQPTAAAGAGNSVTPQSPQSPMHTPTWNSPSTATGVGNPVFPATNPGSLDSPIAVGTGSRTNTVAESIGVKFINYLRFDLQYQVDNGPSGVKQIDLYVTRDGGRSWLKWSQHDGRESPLRVALDQRLNPQTEGDYGFRLVPVSGAGLSEGPPTPGTPPELQVHVDLTPPMIKVYAPTADPNLRNTLVLHWEATDRNFGPDPIAIEWSEHPSGPWKPVVSGEGIVPVVAGQGVNAPRIANTGQFTWALPPSLNTHRVYLKFTAWDAAGNRSEVVTPSPVLVDLTRPKATIRGISP